MMKHSSLSLSALTLAVLASIAAHAAPAVPTPDAGQISRELPKEAPTVAPTATAPLTVDVGSQPTALADQAVRIPVTGFAISGETHFSAAELLGLVNDQVGPARSLADLNQAAARITDFYRSHGFVVARAYLPAQDIKGGVVQIRC